MKYGFSDCETVVIDCSVCGKEANVECIFLVEHFGSLEVKLSDGIHCTLIIHTHTRKKCGKTLNAHANTPS